MPSNGDHHKLATFQQVTCNKNNTKTLAAHALPTKLCKNAWLLVLGTKEKEFTSGNISFISFIRFICFIYFIWFQKVAADRDRSKSSLVKSIPTLPSAVPTTKRRVRWLTSDQHLIANRADRCNSDIRLVQIPFLAVLSTALIPFSSIQCEFMHHWRKGKHKASTCDTKESKKHASLC